MTAVLERPLAPEATRGQTVQEEVLAAASQLYDVRQVTSATGMRDLDQLMVMPEFYSQGAVRQTSLIEQPTAWEHLRIFEKRETEQSIRAFKARGAFLACMQVVRQNPALRHLVTASAGNHGLGVALFVEWYNTQLKDSGQVGVDAAGKVVAADLTRLLVADVYCADGADPGKKEMLRARGATVHDQAHSLEDAKIGANQLTALLGDGAAYIDPFDHPLVMAGQSSVLLETVLQLHDQGVDLRKQPLELRVGGGGFGLANGCAVLMEQLVATGVLHPESTVVAVQMERCNATGRALGRLAQGLPLDGLFVEHGVNVFDPAADGTAVRIPGERSLPLAAHMQMRGFLRVQTVSKHAVAEEMERAGAAGQVVEPAGALPGASLHEDLAYWSKHWVGNPGLLTREDGSTRGVVVVNVVSGGNRSEVTTQAFADVGAKDTDAHHAALSGHFPRPTAVAAPKRGQVPVDAAEQRRLHLGTLAAVGVSLLK